MLICLSVLLLTLSSLAAVEVVDRVARYVGDDIITAGEVWLRVQGRLQEMRRSGQAPPRDRAAFESLRDEALDELTDERLLLREAKRLGVLLDDRPIRREITELARRDPRLASLQAQARLRGQRLDDMRTRMVLRFYADNAGQVTPAEIAASYRERVDDWRRPGRALVSRITLRAASEADLTRLRQGLMRLLQTVQEPQHPAVLQELVGDELRRDLVAARQDPARQLALLLDFGRRLVEAGEGLEQGAALLAQARALLAEHEQLRQSATLVDELEALRDELAGLPPGAEREQAFAAAARRLSMDGRAEAGGDMGWIESEAAGEGGIHAEQAFAVAAGELSPVYGSDKEAFLLLVRESEPGRVRPFTEVSAELQRSLEDDRLEKTRDRLLQQLRRQTLIRDLAPISVEDLGYGAQPVDQD